MRRKVANLRKWKWGNYKIEIKDSDNERDKTVEFTAVETDKKGGKYRIISCIPKKEAKDSIIKTIKTNYQLNP